jgi:hypothetical protein
MKAFKKNHLYLFFLSFLYFSFFFYLTEPFWGLMDDATSLKTALQFSEDPIKTTYEWVKHHNKNGMFRPFFAFQQFLQFSFYNFENPYPTFLLNIIIVLVGIYIFSINFIRKKSILIFYSLFFLWPYTYDWLFLPVLNSKWGLILFGISIALKEKAFVGVIKFLLGVICVLIKLNVVILLPLSFYYEQKNNNELSTTYGMILGLIIQTSFFFYYPDSYYNTGIFESIKSIEFLTIQNILVLIIVLVILLDILFVEKTKDGRIKIFCCLSSIFIALAVLNLRNSSYAYLGALLFFPITTYLIFIFERLDKELNLKKSYGVALLVFSLIFSNIFLLTPRLQRWSDLDSITSYDFTSKAVYFCEEGQKMINIWDIEKNNKEYSYFVLYPDIYENIYMWTDNHKDQFRFIEFDESSKVSFNDLYVIDPFCDESKKFFDVELDKCNLDYIHNNEIKLVKVNSC